MELLVSIKEKLYKKNRLEAILSTLGIMGWLGIVLGILAMTNIVTRTLANVWSKEESFSWDKMLKGIGKVVIFYLSAVAVSIAFTILPFINDMITEAFGVVLLAKDTLTTLSSVAVLSVVVTVIVTQGKKALESVINLSKLSTSNKEEITWKVEEE